MLKNIQEKRIYLKRKMEQSIRRSGYDENFIAAFQFHWEKIARYCCHSKITTREKYVEVLYSHLFQEYMDCVPVKRFKNMITELNESQLLQVPSEMFSRDIIPVENRKIVFYKCLRIGDYLDCRVTSSEPDSAEYQLRVIHKLGVARILDDLGIIVTMRKSDISGLPQVLKEFGISAMVRVIVIEKEQKEPEEEEIKVYVSVIDNKTDLRLPKPQLGTILETDVPNYVKDPYPDDASASYVDHITRHREYFDLSLLNGFFQGFGVNSRKNYSYFPVDESLSSIDVNALVRESKLTDVNEFAGIAQRDLSQEKYIFALSAINLAIETYPKSRPLTKEDKVELSKLHTIKSTIHTSEKSPKMSLDANLEMHKALNLDRTNATAKACLSKSMVMVAMKFYKKKVFKSAAFWASSALKLDENIAVARKLIEHLKVRHSITVEELDQQSIQDLIEKQKEIGSELQKIGMLENVAGSIVPYSFDSSPSPSPSQPQ